MKLLSILLFVGIILHQISLPAINSILFIELTGLAIFWFVVRPWINEIRRTQERRGYLKGVEKRYLSKSGKDWRDSRSSVEVQMNKETYWDRI